MSKGGGGGGTTTVQKADPWSGVQPFLVGSQTTRLKQGVQPVYKQEQTWDPSAGDGGGWTTKNVISNPSSDYETVGSPGVFPEAQRLYQQQGWSQGMQDLTNQQGQNVANRAGQVGQAYGVGNQALSGGFDPSVSRVGNVNIATSAGVTPVANIQGVGDIKAQMVDPTQAFGSLGGANPTSSIQQMLTGQANTSTLDPVVNNAMTRMSQNFNEQVMPGLRNEAVAAGQYGSSRQGIAEGLATRGLAQSMGDMSANMYNNAYNTAQQNMYGTANNMAGLGLNNAQANANRSLTADTTNAANQLNTQQFNANLGLQNNAQTLQNNQFNARQMNAGNQFNANLGLQNNTQAMQLAQQQLANRAQGLNILGTGNALQDQNYQQSLGLLDAPNQYNWNNLNRYASIVTPGAGIGGQSSSTAPNNTNPLAGALGGALAGAQLASMTGLLGTGAGAGIGAGLALLSDRRFKTDIERMGTLDNGLGVYRYRYKSGGPMQLGVMADEVKAVNPAAVVNVGGVDYVNYGGI